MNKPSMKSVSDAELGAMGFPVEDFDMSMGVKVVRVAGVRRADAEFAAWAAGKVTFAAGPARPVGQTFAQANGWKPKAARGVCPDMAAFFGLVLSA